MRGRKIGGEIENVKREGEGKAEVGKRKTHGETTAEDERGIAERRVTHRGVEALAACCNTCPSWIPCSMLPFRSWFYAPSILILRAPRKVSISWTRAGTAAVAASVSIFIITFFSPSRVYWISRTCKVNQKYRPWLLLAVIIMQFSFFFFKGARCFVITRYWRAH